MISMPPLRSLLFSICSCICLLAANGQDDINKNYWQSDSVLQVRLDTLGEQKVIGIVRSTMQAAVDFCQKDQLISTDSAANWIEKMRWAVILDDDGSRVMIDKMNTALESGNKGHVQFSLAYMGLWAAYVVRSNAMSTEEEKVDDIMSRLQSGNNFAVVFYEDRLLDMGHAQLPNIISYVRRHIAPAMEALDGEMLAAEDLRFPMSYDRLIAIIQELVEQAGSDRLIQELIKDEDRQMQRFARDILENN